MSESLLRRRVAPSVPVDIRFSDEQGEFHHTFELAFDFNAVAAVSEVTGEECLNSIEMWYRMDARMLRAMLWAALLRHQPEFDTRDTRGRRNDDGLRAVGSWLRFDDGRRIGDALWKAYLLFLPKDQAEYWRKVREGAEKGKDTESPLVPKNSPEKKEAPAHSDGANSGLSPATISESATTAKSAS